MMPKRLIHKAAIVAVLSHALAFGVSVYVIGLLSIPSTIDRVLNLSLNSTPLDGNISDHPTVNETLNNVEQGTSKSDVIDELQAGLSPSELPVNKEDDSPPAVVKQERTERSNKAQEEIGNPLPSPISTTSEQIVAEQPPAKQPDEKLKETEAPILSRQAENQPALLTLSQVQPTVPVSDTQQQMLNEKLTEMASTVSSLDEMPEHLEWESDGQRYSANVFKVPADSDMGLPEIRVKVKTEMDGTELSTEMSMKQLAFSNFAQFVHRWDSDLQIHEDQLDGRFHSNSRINLEFGRHSGPVFHGKVTTASNRVNMSRHTRRSLKKNVFLGGLETGVKKILMPKPSMLYFDDAPTPDENTVQFEHDTRIIFHSNGTYSTQALTEDSPVTLHTIGAHALYIRASANATLYVQGTINGQVLVYSPKHIIIESSLIYADRRKSEQNDDFLGLVSGRNIVIAGPSVTGRGDLEIDASIYAKGRFVIRGYKTKRSGTLIVFGSLSAGSMSATEPRYATRINFDPRLEHRRPPKFPTTGRYEVKNQKNNWSPSIE